MSRARGQAIAAITSLALLAPAAVAHDYWLLPDPLRAEAGAKATVRLCVGEALKADEERVFQPEKTPRFERIHAKGRDDLRPACKAETTPLCELTLDVAGGHLLVMDRAPTTIELAPEKFADYLKEEGLDSILVERRRRGEEEKPGRERYRRSIKALIRVGAAADGVFGTTCGQEIELVPASDPTLVTVPGELRVTAFFRGQPLAKLQVHATCRDGDELHAASARTDDDGQVSLRLDAAGTWMVAAVHMIRCDEPAVADWDSFWTSYVFALPAPAAPPKSAAAPADDRASRWRADLAFLSKELAAKHKNLFHSLPREEWEARVAELDERIAELEDHEITAELARLVASVGDAHTTVQGGSPPFTMNSAPIELRWFPDGVRLIAAPSEQAAAVGGRVTAIGGIAIDEAWRRASELIAHENEAWLQAQVPSWLAVPPFLHALGLADDGANVRYAIAPDESGTAGTSGNGAPIAVDLRIPANVRSFARAGPKEPPLWLARRREHYWFEYLPESRTLFLQFNRCSDDPKLPFAELAQQLFETADREAPERLVVDLRHNSGGNSLVIAPLFAGFGSHRSLRTRGHLFAVIGPQTFSSGMMNAVQLKEGFGALLVGEPTGGRPNSYGEVKTLELLNSKIRVGYCTKYFQQSSKDVASVEPDVAAPVTWDDWKNGRDPALAAILAWKEP